MPSPRRASRTCPRHVPSRRPTRTTSSRTSSPASAPPLCSSTSSPGCSSCRRLRTSSSQTSYSRREGGPEVCAGPEYADAPEWRGKGAAPPPECLLSSLCGRWSDLTVCVLRRVDLRLPQGRELATRYSTVAPSLPASRPPCLPSDVRGGTGKGHSKCNNQYGPPGVHVARGGADRRRAAAGRDEGGTAGLCGDQQEEVR